MFKNSIQFRVPHELKEKHLTQCINSCDLLKKRNENDPFLKRLITGDEKWVVYNNIKRKRSWSRPREPTQTTNKSWYSSKEGFVISLMGLQRNCLF